MPRLWMVPPAHLCQQHLLGEHHEAHMFLGKLKLKTSLRGYITGNHFSLADLWVRHDALAAELIRRNRSHNSPFPSAEEVAAAGEYLPDHPPIDRAAAAAELYARCEHCRHRAETL